MRRALQPGVRACLLRAVVCHLPELLGPLGVRCWGQGDGVNMHGPAGVTWEAVIR